MDFGPYAKKGKEGNVRTARKGWRGKDGEEILCFRPGRKGKDSEERTAR